MSDDGEIDLIRSKLRARRNGILGILGTCLIASTSIIAQLLQVERADADKNQITLSAAELRAELGTLQTDIRGISERLTVVSERLAKTETKLDLLMAERSPRR